MTKDQEQKLHDLTLKLYQDVYAFLGGDPNTIVLPENQTELGIAFVDTDPISMSSAFCALGSVLCGLILCCDNPHERFRWFQDNLVKDLETHSRQLGHGQPKQ